MFIDHFAVGFASKKTFQLLADSLRKSGNYRWVGFYDVDHAAGLVKNIVWSGEGAPEYPIFPLTKGLTSSAIAFGPPGAFCTPKMVALLYDNLPL